MQMENNTGRIPVTVDSQEYEVLVQDLGASQKLTVFRAGKRIGFREVSHLTDLGPGVLAYTVKMVLLKTKTGLAS